MCDQILEEQRGTIEIEKPAFLVIDVQGVIGNWIPGHDVVVLDTRKITPPRFIWPVTHLLQR